MSFRLVTRLACICSALVLLVQPLVARQVSSSKSVSINISHDSRDNVERWKTSNGFDNFNVEYRGRVDISDDDKDIRGMSDDGYLQISKTVFGSKRAIVIESQGNGNLKRVYYEGRTATAWEPNGKAWLAEILPEVVRTTSLGAESRVTRFFKQGGINAVLSEMDKISSDYVRATYAKLLMKQPVAVKDYPVIISRMSEKTSSDYYMTEFLKSNADKFMQNKEATTALFTATRKMDSDHYKTVVIKEALGTQATSLENVRIILQAASSMDSDHYKTEVLTSLLRQDNLDDARVSEIIKNTQSIDSDHYKTVVLTQAMNKQGISSTSHAHVVEAVKTIDSDHYLTQVLKDLLRNQLTDDVLNTLMTVLPSIESDHYKTEVFTTLLSRQDLKEQQFDKLMASFDRMDSDHYKTVVLQKALNSGNFTEAKLIKVIQLTHSINSDHYITQVLTSAAPKVKAGGNGARDAYRAAARNISSETYYGRALRAIE